MMSIFDVKTGYVMLSRKEEQADSLSDVPELVRNMADFDLVKVTKSDFCSRNYKHFSALGCLSYQIPLNDTLMDSTLCTLWDLHGSLDREIQYAGVLPTEDNVWTSILKMDCGKFELKVDPDKFRRSLDLTWGKLRIALEGDICLFPDFVEDTSATFPFTVLGFKKKRDVLRHPTFWNEWVFKPFDKPCIWRVSPKYEFLHIMDDIFNGKIRTFIIPPLHLLYWQKVFCAEADHNLIKYQCGDIRYGISFAYGGFHRFVSRHGPNIFLRKFIEADVSGWDRVLVLLEHVWKMRKRGLKNVHPSLWKFYDWVEENTLNSILLLPNGDLIRKNWGNNSGSGTTTSDNCLAHQIIMDYLRIHLQDEDICHVLDLLADLYGDDSLASLLTQLTDDELKQIWIHVYSLFGMTIKPSQFKVSTGPIGVGFLGAKCAMVDEMFVPYYNSERIYSSLVSDIKAKSEDETLGKWYALLHLSWHDEELFERISYAIVNAIREIDGPYSDHLHEHGVPSRDRVINSYWLGVEGDEFSSVPKWMEEDFKKHEACAKYD